jgi:hypothetical protein
MPAVPVTVGQIVLAATENNLLDWVDQTEYQSVDLPQISSTGFVDSATLIIPLVAGGVYVLNSLLYIDTPAAADAVIRFSYPTGTTGLISNGGSGTAITTATNAINQQATALSGTSATQTYGGVAAGTILEVKPSGGFTVANAGNLVVGIGQVVSTATNTILKKWSSISLKRIA